ncbi:MAG TPA: TonB-dependent receptor [Gemmatimonadales bacterium]|nr:TonB-dependent receptor [Gemmatimonadales bacterium]
MTLAAQAPVTVRGRVVDAANGTPVAAARVDLGALSAQSGPDGRFVLGGASAGTAVMVVAAVGYRSRRVRLELLPGLDAEATVRLEAMAVTLPDLEVQAAGGQPMTLDGAALVRRGSDLATAIDGWQGIVVRRSGGNGAASPQVRGSAPEEVLVLVDGFSINDPLTGRADLSKLATRDVASVQVRPGAQSAGGAGVAVGGVLDIRSQAAGRPEASGWVGSYGSAGASLSGMLLDTRVFLRGELLPDDYPYSVPVNRGGGEARRVNAGGGLGSLSFRHAGRFDVQGRASVSRRGLPGSVGNETPYAEAEDGAGFVGVTIGGASTWSASLQYLQSTVRDSAPPSGPAYEARSAGWSGTIDWSHSRPVAVVGWAGSVALGASARHDRFGGDVVQDGSQFSRAGLRGTATLRPGGQSPWTLTPSLRLDIWTGENLPLGSARLDAGWQHGATSVQASVGSAVSAPPLADLFFREGVGVALNPGLRPERVRWEVELGVNQDWSLFGAPGSASLRGYYGRVDDMILWAPGVGFIWSPHNFDVTRRGVEAAASIHPVPTVSLAVQGAWTPITYDVPDGAQVQYRPRGTWGASVGWADGAWGADARWRWVGERYPNPGGVNPRPSFGLVDVGAERALGAAVVRADVRDLLDTRAEFLAGYPTPGRTLVVSISLEWQ